MVEALDALLVGRPWTTPRQVTLQGALDLAVDVLQALPPDVAWRVPLRLDATPRGYVATVGSVGKWLGRAGSRETPRGRLYVSWLLRGARPSTGGELHARLATALYEMAHPRLTPGWTWDKVAADLPALVREQGLLEDLQRGLQERSRLKAWMGAYHERLLAARDAVAGHLDRAGSVDDAHLPLLEEGPAEEDPGQRRARWSTLLDAHPASAGAALGWLLSEPTSLDPARLAPLRRLNLPAGLARRVGAMLDDTLQWDTDLRPAGPRPGAPAADETRVARDGRWVALAVARADDAPWYAAWRREAQGALFWRSVRSLRLAASGEDLAPQFPLPPGIETDSPLWGAVQESWATRFLLRLCDPAGVAPPNLLQALARTAPAGAANPDDQLWLVRLVWSAENPLAACALLEALRRETSLDAPPETWPEPLLRYSLPRLREQVRQAPGFPDAPIPAAAIRLLLRPMVALDDALQHALAREIGQPAAVVLLGLAGDSPPEAQPPALVDDLWVPESRREPERLLGWIRTRVTWDHRAERVRAATAAWRLAVDPAVIPPRRGAEKAALQALWWAHPSTRTLRATLGRPSLEPAAWDIVARVLTTLAAPGAGSGPATPPPDISGLAACASSSEDLHRVLGIAAALVGPSNPPPPAPVLEGADLAVFLLSTLGWSRKPGWRLVDVLADPSDARVLAWNRLAPMEQRAVEELEAGLLHLAGTSGARWSENATERPGALRDIASPGPLGGLEGLPRWVPALARLGRAPRLPGMLLLQVLEAVQDPRSNLEVRTFCATGVARLGWEGEPGWRLVAWMAHQEDLPRLLHRIGTGELSPPREQSPPHPEEAMAFRLWLDRHGHIPLWLALGPVNPVARSDPASPPQPARGQRPAGSTDAPLRPAQPSAPVQVRPADLAAVRRQPFEPRLAWVLLQHPFGLPTVAVWSLAALAEAGITPTRIRTLMQTDLTAPRPSGEPPPAESVHTPAVYLQAALRDLAGHEGRPTHVVLEEYLASPIR